MSAHEVKKYAVYRCPDGTVLLDWNDNLWRYGYPAYPKYMCVLLETGECEGGPNLPKFNRKLREKYEK